MKCGELFNIYTLERALYQNQTKRKSKDFLVIQRSQSKSQVLHAKTHADTRKNTHSHAFGNRGRSNPLILFSSHKIRKQIEKITRVNKKNKIAASKPST